MTNSPYTYALDYLQKCGLAYVERFAPYCLMSVGAHLAQLANTYTWEHDKHFLFSARGSPRNVRVHIHFAAPQGFLKSSLWSVFLNPNTGLLATVIPSVIETSTTEAGWVGSYVSDDPTDEANYGMAWYMRYGIVGFDEFSAVMMNMQQEHSSTLEVQLLKTLDSGDIAKKLARIWIHYHSDISVWAATQPARWDLRAGFARRFIFMNWSPSEKEVKTVYEKYLESNDKTINYNSISQFRESTRDIKEKLRNLKSISFDFDLRKHIPEVKFHWMQELAERMLIGYKVINGDFDSQLVVNCDNEAEGLLNQAWQWRKAVVHSAEGSQLVSFLDKPQAKYDIYVFMWGLGYTSDKVDKLLSELIGKHMIKRVFINEKEGYARSETI